MFTNRTYRKAIVAAIGMAAASVPAMLFAGTGIAAADTRVSTTTDVAGVTVHVESVDLGANGPGASDFSTGQLCTYTAEPLTPGPLPVYGLPFALQEFGSHDIWLPGVQTGTQWNVSVACPIGGDITQHPPGGLYY